MAEFAPARAILRKMRRAKTHVDLLALTGFCDALNISLSLLITEWQEKLTEELDDSWDLRPMPKGGIRNAADIAAEIAAEDAEGADDYADD